MKSVMLALGLALVATNSYAISRYNSTSKTCAQVQSIIVRDGAAIMRHTGRSLR